MRMIMPLVAVAALALPGLAEGAECRVTAADAFAGTDTAGAPSGVGLRARVDTYNGVGLLNTLAGDVIEGVVVDFELIFRDYAGVYYLDSAMTDEDGWAVLDIEDYLFLGAGELTYLRVQDENGNPVEVPLDSSQHIQLVTSVQANVSACEGGEVYPDVYGSIYYRHPTDSSYILFTDFDDTLFNSADVEDIFRAMATNHWRPIDGNAAPATQTFRDSGGVFIGVTAQPWRLRPFTRSELQWWLFEDAYELETHNYGGAGFDGTYLPRTIPYTSNFDYDDGGTGVGYVFQHCDYKVEAITLFVEQAFGGHWEDVLGIIGDSEHSDGCAADFMGIHWYALMENGTQIEDTSDPSSYTEFTSGWAEALPVLCADAGLTCQ